MDCPTRVLTEADGRQSYCNLEGSGVPLSVWGHSEFTEAFEWLRHPFPGEFVASEAVEMPGQIPCFPGGDQGVSEFVEHQNITHDVRVVDKEALTLRSHLGGHFLIPGFDLLADLLQPIPLVAFTHYLAGHRLLAMGSGAKCLVDQLNKGHDALQ